mmetsp:Transcript_25899/g.57141  ORF Transcript_25899/g.57141 Transcript_25899/m.57141 type:complete len:236 (+) Transcript_25899:203-910(+)
MFHRCGMPSRSVSSWLTGIPGFGSHLGATAGRLSWRAVTPPLWKLGCTIWKRKNCPGQHQPRCQLPMERRAIQMGRILRRKDQTGPDQARQTGKSQLRISSDRARWGTPMTVCWRSCGRYVSKMPGYANAWPEPESLSHTWKPGSCQRHPASPGLLIMATAQWLRIVQPCGVLQRIPALCGMVALVQHMQQLRQRWVLQLPERPLSLPEQSRVLDLVAVIYLLMLLLHAVVRHPW